MSSMLSRTPRAQGPESWSPWWSGSAGGDEGVAMPRESAGLLLFRRRAGAAEVFLVHPGGPFWAKKDEHAWSIPKGELAADEDPLTAARREFTEETSLSVEG